MSALEHEHDVEGGEGETAYAPDETTIDASQLKLPSFKWAEDATAGKTGEEDEDVIYKQYVAAAPRHALRTRRAVPAAARLASASHT